jgi:hypothetical protein
MLMTRLSRVTAVWPNGKAAIPPSWPRADAGGQEFRSIGLIWLPPGRTSTENWADVDSDVPDSVITAMGGIDRVRMVDCPAGVELTSCRETIWIWIAAARQKKVTPHFPARTPSVGGVSGQEAGRQHQEMGKY